MTQEAVGGWAETWEGAKRVLAVRLDSLGDVLMTAPALRAIKESGAERRITLLTSPAGAEAGRLSPGVDDVIPFSAPWMKSTQPRANSAAEHEVVRRLRGMEFDAAIIFTVYSQNPLPAALLA